MKSINANRIGIMASSLCVLHCAITPLLFAFQTMTYIDFGGSEKEACCETSINYLESMDYIFLIVSFLAVYFSIKHTHKPNIKYLMWGAWVIFASGIFLEPYSVYGFYFVCLGSIILGSLHVYNRKHKHSHT